MRTPKPTEKSVPFCADGRLRSQGAELVAAGVRYRTWCKHEHATVVVVDEGEGILRRIELQEESHGYFSAIDEEGAAGDQYRYRFGQSSGWPDPASRWQPKGIHGPSMVIDPRTFPWTDDQWRKPRLTELIIYELHVGTFTPEGSFRSAIGRLDHLVDLGVTALELMPIAEFPGERNWGYDGVAPYAPARAYGHPDELRSLVDAAHAHGLAVILDVVYNHLGPDGNYLGVYHGSYFNARYKTPWGDGLNFAEPAVREFILENPIYWMREFHIDGFRLDATHAIADFSARHILAEISERVHAEGGILIAEDERNEPSLLRALTTGGLGFDACWSDDFHHVVRVSLTGERDAYYENFQGTVRELADTLKHGWLYRGQSQKSSGQPRGGESIELAPEQFVYCISNHDQTGNRAFGDRLGHAIAPAAYRAASALLCLVPGTPMLFMGQEWSASTPFRFFTDHNIDLGRLVSLGRRHEFRHFAAFKDPALLETIPDPQDAETFAQSKLCWEERTEPPHADILRLYQDFLAFRRSHPAFRDRARENWNVTELDEGVLALVFNVARQPTCIVVADLIGGHREPDLSAAGVSPWEHREWQASLSSNDARYGGTGNGPFREPTTMILLPAETR